MTDDHFEALRRRDEILEVMYWMRGEQLHDAVSAADLEPFLGATAQVLADDLIMLAGDGLVAPAEPSGARRARFRLSERGIGEGGRRFADSFADFQHPGHGECSRPGCLCHQLGPDACVSRVAEPA